MVTHKRKLSTDRDRYGDFDSVIEIDDARDTRRSARPYSDTYEGEAYIGVDMDMEPLTYTPRQEVRNYVAVPAKPEKQRQARLHEIKRAPVAVKTSGKQALSSRTKLILFTYLAVAAVLAAVVIGTGLAVTNTGTRVNALEQELAAQTLILGEQELVLHMLSDDIFMAGLAAERGMEFIQGYTAVDLIGLQPVADFEPSTNWFDSVSRFFSRIFAR